MATTRLAPSPTGALHLGNARTFLVNWILARQFGWHILLRIEDLDGPRIKPAADRLLIEDLKYLGIDWDEGPVYQSSRMSEYRAAIESLMARGMAYPCVCSRKEVDSAASAPHGEDGATIYPGTCRGKFASARDAEEQSGRKPAIRFAAIDRDVEFDDRFAGRQSINVARRLGDFVIAKSDGTPAYQLAVVVDDLAGGVTEVVRGTDLLESTHRQILLYDCARSGKPDSALHSSAAGCWNRRAAIGQTPRRYAHHYVSRDGHIAAANAGIAGEMVRNEYGRAGH